MPESHIIEDEAALYVLGQLGAAERHAFEARLAQSAELRALVGELEASTVALALAVPQHQPPPRVWQRIEDNVNAFASSQLTQRHPRNRAESCGARFLARVAAPRLGSGGRMFAWLVALCTLGEPSWSAAVHGTAHRFRELFSSRNSISEFCPE